MKHRNRTTRNIKQQKEKSQEITKKKRNKSRIQQIEEKKRKQRTNNRMNEEIERMDGRTSKQAQTHQVQRTRTNGPKPERQKESHT